MTQAEGYVPSRRQGEALSRRRFVAGETRSGTLIQSQVASAWTSWIARLVVFVAFFDLFVQYPLAAPYAESLGASPGLAGLVVASYSIANLVGNIGAGPLLDRFGRIGPLLASLIATVVALTAYTVVTSALQLLAIRVLHGLAVATLAPGAFALIGDIAPPEQRARAMGINGTLIAVAAVVAPPLAGIVQDRAGYAPVFLADAALMALAAVVVVMSLRLLPSWRPPRSPDTESFSSRRYLRLARRPRLRLAYVAILAFALSLGLLVTHLPLALVADGRSAALRGFAFSIYAVVAAAVMVSPLSRASDRHGRLTPIGGGLLFVGLGLIILALSLARSPLALGMGIFGLGFGLLFPSTSALVVEASAPEERGSAFALFYALYSVGVILGALLSGFLAEAAGTSSGLPFLVSGLLAVTAGGAVARNQFHPPRREA